MWHNFMVTQYRLKVHISGQHDFEAEGDKETVERQFATFTELVRAVMAKSGANGDSQFALPESLAKIVRTDDKAIFLATVPETEQPSADALLILLLAYKVMRNLKMVSGADLMESMERSGIEAQRIDRAFGHYLGGTQALVMKMGIRRGVKYRLTDRGIAKAKEIARNI
jgi:hypothetical protein